MKLIINILIMPIAILLVLSCCNSRRDKTVQNKLNSNDTFIKDLPRTTDGKITQHYFFKDPEEKRTGFETLERGFDSLKIRIWYGYIFSDTQQVVEISNTKGKWLAAFFTLKDNYIKEIDSVVSVDKTVQYSIPKSGWNNFISKLFSLDILTLPDCENIPNYPFPMDAAAINVEIATKKLYRYYSYSSPHILKNRVSEAKKLVEIIDLVEEELNFKALY